MIEVQDVVEVSGHGKVFIWNRTEDDMNFTVPLQVGDGIMIKHNNDFYRGNIAGLEMKTLLVHPPKQHPTISITLRGGYLCLLEKGSLERESHARLREEKLSTKTS